MYYETQCQNPVSCQWGFGTIIARQYCCLVLCTIHSCKQLIIKPFLQVHLRVDTALTNNKLDIVAYIARHLTLGDRSTSLAQEFQEVPCEVRTVEVERLGSKHALIPPAMQTVYFSV